MTLFDRTVEVVDGDLTKPETLRPAMTGARHMTFTAGIRSGCPAREHRTKAVDYEGMRHTLSAARECRFTGRFLYMTSSGGVLPSFSARCLNLWKGNTLVWRRRAEEVIRASGLDYTIIRTGVLLNQPGRQHAIEVTQQPLPLAWRYRIARADVAELFLAALEHERAACTTFEAVWGLQSQPEPLKLLLKRLQPDEVCSKTVH